MNRLVVLIAAAAPAIMTPAHAQHDGHHMHGGHVLPAPEPDHSNHGASPVAHPSQGHGANPAVPAGHAADTLFDPAAMARARAALRRETGGMTVSLIRFDLAEYRIIDGRDGYRYDAEARFGGDVDRFVIKSEGEGAFGRRAEEIEIQALWAHAIDPWFDLQIGVRHDVLPDPSRTYAAIGLEGVLPYWPELEATAFLSDKGDLTAELTAEYDMRISRRWILQPRIEVTLAAQDVPEQGIGAGLSDIDLGLRLRYQIVPEAAPYVGIGWTRRIGDAARFARAAGDDPSEAAILLGIRAWF